jgi:hypothetical protein
VWKLYVEVTSAEDRVSHRVAYPVYEAGLLSGEGRYTAMCGRTVLAASMVCVPGRQCALCRAAVSGPGG